MAAPEASPQVNRVSPTPPRTCVWRWCAAGAGRCVPARPGVSWVVPAHGAAAACSVDTVPGGGRDGLGDHGRCTGVDKRDRLLEALRGKYPGVVFWYVINYVGPTTWCARLPGLDGRVLNEDSPEVLDAVLGRLVAP